MALLGFLVLNNPDLKDILIGLNFTFPNPPLPIGVIN